MQATALSRYVCGSGNDKNRGLSLYTRVWGVAKAESFGVR